MQILHLDNDDDIISICDRLDWQPESQVLLVLPEHGGALCEGLDLVRLRRHADKRRMEVGLVTAVSDISRQAKALGFPVFLTIEAGQRNRRHWWRGRRRREFVGLSTLGGVTVQSFKPAILDKSDRQEVYRRLSPHPTWLHWFIRYAAILLFFITLALLVVSFLYTVPTATVTLKPQVLPVRVTTQLIADPTLTEVDRANSAVPARLLFTTQAWETSAVTTGLVDVASASARGTVVFVNRLSQEVTIPAGTRVSTSQGNNVIFQTVDEVVVAEAVGSTAEVDIVAVEPGPQGNVGANLINRIVGSLSLRLDVRNLEPTEGGGVRTVPAVTGADQLRLRSQVLQYLQAVAASELEAQLADQEFLAHDSLHVADVTSETYSHFAGEQTEKLTLEIRAVLQGTAVNTTAATDLAYEALAQQIPAGYTLIPASLRFQPQRVLGVDDQGRVQFEMMAEGQVAVNLSLEQPLETVAGQPSDLAIAYLYEQLPLRDIPIIEVWPVWFGRMPYLPARIQLQVQPSDNH